MPDLTFPASLRYSRDHEWVTETREGSVVRVGISDFAQDQLGDVVFVDLPDVGDSVTANENCGEVESTKSVSDIVAPVSGEVIAVNESLEDAPEVINSDPYGDGWLFDVELSDVSELDTLMDADAYAAAVESEGA
ncbi:glycine cleavage system protein GcvH [Brevibacterium sp. p3-SID960]|uniref:glycine cleavage system protein GcvH n=1 Tax=Brevibacterium sp. p3-SID960 TaxID=2916063 RepID=UPI0021A4F6F0|nr:glycine cleavage system protein GcvH [Brevibacterium sp. p3-SID960]MCT1690696.1 glycine cleavage system protein GcvH [Brevibacterium sp. p3-SID960]